MRLSAPAPHTSTIVLRQTLGAINHRFPSCLLTVDLGVQQVDIEVFSPEDEVSAADKYTELETGKEEPGIIYLLARAGSMKDLRFAYPNYSSDISQFVGWLTETING